MILNIFGPSGSGKTTFANNLLKHKKVHSFFEKITSQNLDHFQSDVVSVSLVPLPKFRGTVIDFFNIFSID